MDPELLTVIVTSVSCVAFCLVILLLVVVFYRKEPLCCRYRPYETEAFPEDSPHYHSRHTLIGIGPNEHSPAMNQGVVGPQIPGRLFVVGKPIDYHLNENLPRLPSYESVRKKDRQRQISSLISQRFGLNGCHREPPPTYEETLRQPRDISAIHVHSLDVNQIQYDSSQPCEGTHNPTQPSPGRQRSSSPSFILQSSSFLSI